MTDLTISVVSANNKKLIMDCLRSIYENAEGISLETYVVINASADDSEQAVREQIPEVKLIVNREKLSFTYNHNMVMRKAKGRYVLVLNDDTLIMDNALKKMVDFMDEHPEVGVTGCRILNADMSLQWSAGSSFTHKFSYFRTGILYALIPFFPKQHFNSAREVSWVTGACFMVRSTAIREVGVFDENIIIYYEDGDLSYRMIQAGWKIYFYPGASIIHYHGMTRKQYFARDMYIIFKSRFYFFSKHYSRISYDLIRTVTLTEVGMRYIRTQLFPGGETRDKNIKKEEILHTYRKIIRLALSPYPAENKGSAGKSAFLADSREPLGMTVENLSKEKQA